MAKKMENKLGPAFDKWRSDPGFKKDFDKEYQDFALSELMLASWRYFTRGFFEANEHYPLCAGQSHRCRSNQN